MILKMFSVYDSKALIFNAPFFMPQVGQAMRSFGDLVKDKNSSISAHPSDYILYQVGEYDDQTGQAVACVPPVHLAVGTEFVDLSSLGRSAGIRNHVMGATGVDIQADMLVSGDK